MLAYSDAIARGDASPPPIARLIGFDLISVKPGEAVVEFQATEAPANPMGTLHGGVLCDIADIAMEVDARTQDQLPEASLESSPEGCGRVVKQRRTVGWVECDRTDEKGSLVARATSTGMTLRGNKLREGKQSDSLNL